MRSLLARTAGTVLGSVLALSLVTALVPQEARASPQGIRLGASVLDPRLGSGLVQRIFFEGRLEVIPRNRPVSVTFNEWDTGDVERVVRQLAPGSTIGYWHEPDEDVQQGRLNGALWRERTVELAKTIARDNRVGQVFPEATFMGWSLFPASGRADLIDQLVQGDVANWLRAEHGMLGWDQYAGPLSYAHTPYADLYQHVARWSDARGLDWAQFEFNWGGGRHNAPALAEFFRGSFAYVQSSAVPRPPRFMIVWNPPRLLGGSMAVQDVPQAAAVWRQQAR